ncbi:hypothetical protein QJQ45_009581 [Haematococcus lacustris]|nr:hypothetical protein QJQ45_009581 [Haematococcus lacustris]
MHPPGVGAEGEGEELLSESHQALNDFLVWLVANDVQGIGFDDSPVALYEECGRPGDASSPERGLMAQRDIAAGEVVLRVPLRLALTDHAADRESNRLVYEDAPWSVRLATKLLREVGKGRTSPWFPYLRVLPARLPVPLETFGWEDMQQLEWAPAQAAIYEYNWLVTEAYNRAAGSRSPSPSLVASTPAGPTPLAAASPSPSEPHTLPDPLNATPPSPSPSPSSSPPAAASPPPARSASPDPAWGLGPGLAASLAPGPRSPSPGPFPWPSPPKIDLGGVGQDTGQQGGAVVEPQGGAWGGEGEGQWGVSGGEGGAWRDRGVGPGPVVDWTVRERQRVGSPAPTTDQIRQVLGGASPEEFQWAMALVHSRTFANAAPGGGVGVRMLVPLVDMMNHAGDVSASGFMDDVRTVRATDNVRQGAASQLATPSCLPPLPGLIDLVKPIGPHMARYGWLGASLLLSYGERSSDDFLVHYGFVPSLCNPHEDAVVFEDVGEALEWHHVQYAAQLSDEAAEAIYSRAYSAALQEQKLSGWSARQQQEASRKRTAAQTRAGAAGQDAQSGVAAAAAAAAAASTGAAAVTRLESEKGEGLVEGVASQQVDRQQQRAAKAAALAAAAAALQGPAGQQGALGVAGKASEGRGAGPVAATGQAHAAAAARALLSGTGSSDSVTLKNGAPGGEGNAQTGPTAHEATSSPLSQSPSRSHSLMSGSASQPGWQRLKVYAGGRVDPALIIAFAMAAEGDGVAAELAVARRAAQLLASMPSPLLLDLWALYEDAKGCGMMEEAEQLGALMMRQAAQQQELDQLVLSALTPPSSSAPLSDPDLMEDEEQQQQPKQHPQQQQQQQQQPLEPTQPGSNGRTPHLPGNSPQGSSGAHAGSSLGRSTGAHASGYAASNGLQPPLPCAPPPAPPPPGSTGGAAAQGGGAGERGRGPRASSPTSALAAASSVPPARSLEELRGALAAWAAARGGVGAAAPGQAGSTPRDRWEERAAAMHPLPHPQQQQQQPQPNRHHSRAPLLSSPSPSPASPLSPAAPAPGGPQPPQVSGRAGSPDYSLGGSGLSGPPVLLPPLTANQRLCLRYRVTKKLVLAMPKASAAPPQPQGAVDKGGTEQLRNSSGAGPSKGGTAGVGGAAGSRPLDSSSQDGDLVPSDEAGGREAGSSASAPPAALNSRAVGAGWRRKGPSPMPPPAPATPSAGQQAQGPHGAGGGEVLQDGLGTSPSPSPVSEAAASSGSSGSSRGSSSIANEGLDDVGRPASSTTATSAGAAGGTAAGAAAGAGVTAAGGTAAGAAAAAEAAAVSHQSEPAVHSTSSTAAAAAEQGAAPASLAASPSPPHHKHTSTAPPLPDPSPTPAATPATPPAAPATTPASASAATAPQLEDSSSSNGSSSSSPGSRAGTVQTSLATSAVQPPLGPGQDAGPDHAPCPAPAMGSSAHARQQQHQQHQHQQQQQGQQQQGQQQQGQGLGQSHAQKAREGAGFVPTLELQGGSSGLEREGPGSGPSAAQGRPRGRQDDPGLGEGLQGLLLWDTAAAEAEEGCCKALPPLTPAASPGPVMESWLPPPSLGSEGPTGAGVQTPGAGQASAVSAGGEAGAAQRAKLTLTTQSAALPLVPFADCGSASIAVPAVAAGPVAERSDGMVGMLPSQQRQQGQNQQQEEGQQGLELRQEAAGQQGWQPRVAPHSTGNSTVDQRQGQGQPVTAPGIEPGSPLTAIPAAAEVTRLPALGGLAAEAQSSSGSSSSSSSTTASCLGSPAAGSGIRAESESRHCSSSPAVTSGSAAHSTGSGEKAGPSWALAVGSSAAGQQSRSRARQLEPGRTAQPSVDLMVRLGLAGLPGSWTAAAPLPGASGSSSASIANDPSSSSSSSAGSGHVIDAGSSVSCEGSSSTAEHTL